MSDAFVAASSDTMSDAFVAAAAACSQRRFYAAEKAWFDESYAKFSKPKHSRIAHHFALDPRAAPWVPKKMKKTVTFNSSAQISGYLFDDNGLARWKEAETVPLRSIPEILHPGRRAYERGQAAVPTNASLLWELRPDLRPSSPRQSTILRFLEKSSK
mgnify:CR=1 FL=1|tara:strand:- start:694 stop:1167 length:474 start_codon:yes stop_codon:yes gene_type:complete